jgi:hypothetical protein
VGTMSVSTLGRVGSSATAGGSLGSQWTGGKGDR